MNNCKDCKYWKYNQQILSYDTEHGICLCPSLQYRASGPVNNVMVYNEDDLHSKHYNFCHNVEHLKDDNSIVPVLEPYKFVTGRDFGCVHFKPFFNDTQNK